MLSDTVEKPFRVGIFSTVPQADKAVKDLVAAGFTTEQISVICTDEDKERRFGRLAEHIYSGRETPEFIAAGGLAGAAIGGLALAATAVATGGVGLLAAGTVLIGGGALAGSFTGAMATRGFDKEIADYYDQAVRLGKILVAVEVHGEEAPRRLAEAERIFEKNGVEPVALVEG